jgi:hypothetical protein
MTPEPIPASEILHLLNRAFLEELNRAARVPGVRHEPVPSCVAFGDAFLNKTAGNAMAAYNEALAFRDSKPGKAVREQFRSLVTIGATSNKQGVLDRVEDFARSLRSVARNHFGTAWQPDPNEAFLLSLFGPWRTIAGKIVEMVPRTLRERATQLLNQPLSESGFQILFRHYLDAPRDSS